MTEPFLEATIRGDRTEAERLCGLALWEEWFTETGFAAMRLAQLRDETGYRPWGPHLIALRTAAGASGSAGSPGSPDAVAPAAVGRIGFHTVPCPDYLEPYAPGGIEIGYAIAKPYRGNGYATEACLHLMRWASEEHGVDRFVLSISPSNEPSLRIAGKLGFQRIGEWQDPEDGLEYVFAYPSLGR